MRMLTQRPSKEAILLKFWRPSWTSTPAEGIERIGFTRLHGDGTYRITFHITSRAE